MVITEVPRLYGFHIVAPLLAGYRFLGIRWGLPGDVIAVSGIVLMLVLLGFVLTRRNRFVRTWALVSLVYSFALFAGMVFVRGSGGFEPAGDYPMLSGNRYMVTPMLLLVTSIFVILFAEASTRANTWVLVGRSTFILLMITMVVIHFRTPNPRSHGPLWSSALGAASRECAGPTLGIVRTPITPHGWFVTLPCARLVR
jgi:hypothetical protein